jgi:hypothetical protein
LVHADVLTLGATQGYKSKTTVFVVCQRQLCQQEVPSILSLTASPYFLSDLIGNTLPGPDNEPDAMGKIEGLIIVTKDYTLKSHTIFLFFYLESYFYFIDLHFTSASFKRTSPIT